MQLHKLACSYMSLHAVHWACMQFIELACSSAGLSSSQEFRSACSLWTSSPLPPLYNWPLALSGCEPFHWTWSRWGARGRTHLAPWLGCRLPWTEDSLNILLFTEIQKRKPSIQDWNESIDCDYRMFKCLAPIRNFNLENMKCGKVSYFISV